MAAIVQDTYGTAAVLQSREIPMPVIADNEVLVRVCAAGVNPAGHHSAEQPGFNPARFNPPGIDPAGAGRVPGAAAA